LWTLLNGESRLTELLEQCDALVAIDQGGIRSAFHLARRHSPAIATNGLAPALVELAARG
ncbi:MAG TPA: hypothetical protein GXZ60_10470, partial [Intrasporangiaceae bacterium]|nr:hypothetical protein [Intrasporangiaceae bacterium]